MAASGRPPVVIPIGVDMVNRRYLYSGYPEVLPSQPGPGPGRRRATLAVLANTAKNSYLLLMLDLTRAALQYVCQLELPMRDQCISLK